MATNDWRTTARADIANLSDAWARRYGWAPRVVEDEGGRYIDVYVTFNHPDRRYLLRLRYEEDYLQVGRRETFCNQDDSDLVGVEYWPPEAGAFKGGREAICIPGTYGFHHKLHSGHSNRPQDTTLGQLLIRIQRELVPPT